MNGTTLGWAMVIGLLGTVPLNADKLPALTEKPWLGIWIAYEQREFDFAIGASDARAELHPKVKGKEGWAHVGIWDRFQIVYVLEEEVKGKWVRRMMTEGSCETDDPASAEAEACEFVATFDGGSKARIRHRFERKKIIISAEVAHTATDHPVRAGVLILTPSIHGVLKFQNVPDQEEIEELMDDDEIRATRSDGERFKIKLHEKVTLSDPDLLADGAEEFSIEVKKYGGKPIVFSSSAKGGGKILFTQTKRLFEPYRVTWYPAENKKPSQGAELVIEFK